MKLGESLYKSDQGADQDAAGAGSGDSGNGAEPDAEQGEDKVVDADFEEVDEDDRDHKGPTA